MNAAAFKLLGQPPQNVLNDAEAAASWLKSKVHPADTARVAWVGHKFGEGLWVDTGPDEIKDTYRIIQGDGEWMWVEGRLKVAKVRSQDVTEMVVMHTIVLPSDTPVFDIAQDSVQTTAPRSQALITTQHAASTIDLDFADTLCHEIRNPLSGASGNLELLKIALTRRKEILMAALSAGQGGIGQGGMEGMREMMWRLNQVAKDEEEFSMAVMECSRHAEMVVSGNMALPRGKEIEERRTIATPFGTEGDDGDEHQKNQDVRDLIVQVSSMLQAKSKLKAIKLRTSFPSEIPAGIGVIKGAADVHAIKQVVFNLVLNAIRHTQEGGRIIVGVEIVNSTEMGCDIDESSRIENNGEVFTPNCIRVYVEDDGVGMTPVESSRLFRRFSQPTFPSSASPKVSSSRERSSTSQSFPSYSALPSASLSIAIPTFSFNQPSELTPTMSQSTTFQQVTYPQSPQQPSDGGFGLGLVISRRLIESMGGSMTVASEKGIGTRFSFTLTPNGHPLISEIPDEEDSHEMDNGIPAFHADEQQSLSLQLHRTPQNARDGISRRLNHGHGTSLLHLNTAQRLVEYSSASRGQEERPYDRQEKKANGCLVVDSHAIK
ncbi:hypothetical protein HDU67_004856 [Dinochytrium kinnereticum]|nr:hypothetical protein HDU67_004856 [Dinochytrium kinnereticum]